MNIQAGEYGRTNKGKIFIFAWIEYSDGKIDESKVLLINNDILSNDFYYFNIGEEIVKHSKDIIDLIEVGDYVNGEKIIEILDKNETYNGKKLVCSIRTNFGEEDIKTVVTKELFKSIEYEVN